MAEEFREFVQGWARAACEGWRYPEPGDEYYDRVFRRLPEGLRALIAAGVREDLIIPQGVKFRLKNLPVGKGSYAWFTRRSTPKEPSPNWEYFVQVAEFVRLSHIAQSQGLTVTFEDHLMDLALYREGRLVVCCEVKERASQLQELVKGLRAYEKGIDFSQPDYFSLVAIGARMEYHVRYQEGRTFELVRNVIPWV